MKQMMRTLAVTGIATTALFAVGTSQSMAAAPAAPVYSMTATKVKVTEGRIFNSGGRGLFVDGSTVYATTSRNIGNGCSLNLTRSADSGITWWNTESLVAGETLGCTGMGIFVSADKVFPGSKIIHTLWAQSDVPAGTLSTYYRYFSTQSNAWSTPVRVNGSVTGTDIIQEENLVVGSDGQVHLYFLSNNKFYYTTSSAPGSFFTEPVQIAAAALSGSIAVDGANNVLFAYAAADGAYFTKKVAGSTAWSKPVKLGTDVTTEGHVSIDAIDANNLYASHTSVSGFLRVYKSTNGGASWTSKTVSTATTGYTYYGTSLVVNKSTKVVNVAAKIDTTTTGIEQNEVYRSADGATWSTKLTVTSGGHPSLALDSAGKLLHMHRYSSTMPGLGSDQDFAVFVSKEK